jgi:hypothetical protein
MTSTPHRRVERFSMSLPALAFRAAVLAFWLSACAGVASSAAAQGRSAEDARAIEGYRLTMPMLRKVLPAMVAVGAERCQKRRPGNPDSLGLAELTRRLEACSPVVRSLQQAGVKTGDAALLFAALLHAGHESARRGGRASSLPPGAVRDNALLLEQNDAEIRRLTKTGGPS